MSEYTSRRVLPGEERQRHPPVAIEGGVGALAERWNCREPNPGDRVNHFPTREKGEPAKLNERKVMKQREENSERRKRKKKVCVYFEY